MRIRACAGVLLLCLLLVHAGCEQSILRPPPAQTSGDGRDLFGPATMRLHPIFTQVKNLDGSLTGRPDGIEAVLEFDDRFGDPTKASGAVIFELYAIRKDFPDERGNRLAEPWTASLTTVDQQQAHWRREIGSYSFLLAFDQIRDDRDYVLTTTFEPLTGKRLFAQLDIPARVKPSTRKSNGD